MNLKLRILELRESGNVCNSSRLQILGVDNSCQKNNVFRRRGWYDKVTADPGTRTFLDGFNLENVPLCVFLYCCHGSWIMDHDRK